MNKYKIIFVFLITIFIIQFADAGQKDFIIKLKKNTPQNVINIFKNNSYLTDNNSLSKTCREQNINNSRVLFKSSSLTNISNYSRFGLDRIFILSTDSLNLKSSISLISSNEYIEYVELNNVLKLEGDYTANYIPNDPYYTYQYYLSLIGMQDVWGNSVCDSTILIGVIDSGLDFLHPDLQKSFFINYGEYGNGKENNGIDDDGNGFIDDWRGWNFVHYFDGGNLIGGNNDPTDDNKFSHGTAVTGIINASTNNGIGISSIAPNSKVLVLKAFDADGNGEESDVAVAILYGISAGVKIFNFSFGDYTYSNLLRDVIRFAYSQNIFISCSAGNDASFRLHYPSAFDEVTSVASSDALDSKSSFSSYGTTVDIFAPGSLILSTTRIGKGNQQFGNDYDYVNGTSFSAPIIAGVAAHLLKQNSRLKPEEIRGILVSSTSYLNGQSGWNFELASGRINAISSLNNSFNPSIARIYNPYQDYSFANDTVPICISAASPLFSSYSIYYGISEYPQNIFPLVSNVASQVISDTVFKWNTSALADTSYTLSLIINLQNGRTIQHSQVIYKDRSNPIILDYSFGNLIDKNNYSELVEFTTNKKTLGKIYFKRKNINEPFQFIYADGGSNIGVITQSHSGLIKCSDLIPDTDYEFYIEVISLNGKSSVLSNPAFVFKTGSEINSYGFVRKNYSLPALQLCNKIVDIGNGKDNLFANEINNNLRTDVYTFSSGIFQRVSGNPWNDFIIVRDLGDVNSDSKIEMLASKGRNGFLFKPPSNSQLPTSLVWSDTLGNNFWASRIADTDGDSLKEIIGFGKTGLRILENTGSFNFVEIANLPYEGGASSEPNSQNVLVEDFDNDGKLEIVFTNLIYNNPSSSSPNTVLQVYKCVSNNTYSKVFSYTFDRFIKGENLVSGDFLGDGKKEFAVGTVTNDNNPSQYYSLYVFKYQNGNYSIVGNVDIYNNKPTAQISTKSGNIDNGSQDEILVNTGLYFYILKFDVTSQSFKPVFYLNDINSFNQLVYDFDKNGVNEIGLNTNNDTLFFYEKNVANQIPPTPLSFKVFAIDSNKVTLSFDQSAGADYYKIYRSSFDSLHFVLLDSVQTPGYIDINLINRKDYFYFVSAVDTSLIIRESQPSVIKKAFTHNKSRLLSASYLGNGFILTVFSEKVNYLIPPMNSFILSNGLGSPKNISFKNDFEYLLSFGQRIPNGNYSISSRNLSDFYGSPVDSNIVNFQASQSDTQKFYMQKLSLAGKYRLQVEFNLPVDSSSLNNLNNYVFEPFFQKVITAERDNSNPAVVYLNLENKGYIGASGRNYILRITNLYSQNGIKIVDGAGSFLGLTFNRENLEEVTVYPDPYRINSGKNIITFANLTPVASIYIYDLTGKFISKVDELTSNGGADWDLKNQDGNFIPSGIYIFRATGKDSRGIDVKEKVGKFAVIK
jgi:hypothetical protein